MAHVIHSDHAQEVEVFPPVHIIGYGALGSLECDLLPVNFSQAAPVENTVNGSLQARGQTTRNVGIIVMIDLCGLGGKWQGAHVDDVEGHGLQLAY